MNGVVSKRVAVTIPARDVRVGDYIREVGEAFAIIRTNGADEGWLLDYWITVERDA